MTEFSTTPRSGVPPKATLICPGCDHTAPPDGDWRLRRRTTETVYRCPDCGTELTRRPASGGWSLSAAALATVPAMVVSLWRGYTRDLRRLFGR